MKQEEITKWRSTIENCEKWMRPKHKRWEELLKLYNLELKVGGMADEFVQRISRFYPMTRRLIASVSFNYPRAFLSVDEEPFEHGAEVLERFGNESLEAMKAKPEVQQCIFDALYCFRGFLKIGFNTAGKESEAPYVTSDSLANDFPFVKRINPFNVFVDPLCPPNDFSAAQYVIERMLVPLEFVKADPRFSKFKRQFKALGGSDPAITDMLTDIHNGLIESNVEEDAIKEAKRLSQMVCLHEIHDRIHRKRIVFANDIEDPVEDIQHPFAEVEAQTASDPLTGQELLTGEFKKGEGFIIEGGFPYYSLAFDACDRFYGLPMMEYVKDPQQIIVDSMSRRIDLLKKHDRITLGSKAEKANNAQLPTTLRDLDDGDVLYVDDVGSAFRELQWGSVPNDQYQVEADAQRYEAHIIEVASRDADTATEASIFATEAQINREWLQVSVQGCYQWIITNTFSIIADDRYTPNNHMVNTSPDGESPRLTALEGWWFRGRRRVEIETGSMQPLVEQLERDDTLGLYDRIIQLPEVDRPGAIKMMVKAFRFMDPEKILKDDANTDAATAAQMEHQILMSTGQMPPPVPGQDNTTHFQMHNEFLQQIVPQIQAGQMPVTVFQAVQAHNQQHEQLETQAGGALGSPAMVSMDGPFNLQGQVQSNAQKISSTIEQNAGEVRF
ncbi:MAG TPA: hypothetical protein DIU35_08355 [Candidatus Latescibacteria bacterium]|nr:hypothetical protein [Candidatus Latescibacterota bacterium]